MRRSGFRRRHSLGVLGLALLTMLPGLGCGPVGLLLMSLAGGAAALSGEPQRLVNTQGQDFDEQRISLIQKGTHTTADVENIMGNPQTKVFTEAGEEWAYRYHVPPSLLRAGFEKILTIRFQEGKVQDVRYSITSL